MRRWWTRLLPYALPYRAELTLIVVLMLAGVGITLLLPWPPMRPVWMRPWPRPVWIQPMWLHIKPNRKCCPWMQLP